MKQPGGQVGSGSGGEVKGARARCPPRTDLRSKPSWLQRDAGCWDAGGRRGDPSGTPRPTHLRLPAPSWSDSLARRGKGPGVRPPPHLSRPTTVSPRVKLSKFPPKFPNALQNSGSGSEALRHVGSSRRLRGDSGGQRSRASWDCRGPGSQPDRNPSGGGRQPRTPRSQRLLIAERERENAEEREGEEEKNILSSI